MVTKEIPAIYHEVVTSSDKEFIEHAFLGYYSKRFGGVNKSLEKATLETLLKKMPRLADDKKKKKEWVEEPVILEEIERAINGFSSQKTPGPDVLNGK